MKRYLILTLIFALSACSAPQEKKDTSHRIVSSKTFETTIVGKPIIVPKHPKVIASVVRLEPGESLAPHKHPYPRYAYVLKGEVEVTLEETGEVIHGKQGEFFVETINGWHYGSNKGSEPVELLVIDQMPKNAKTNTVHRDGARH